MRNTLLNSMINIILYEVENKKEKDYAKYKADF